MTYVQMLDRLLDLAEQEHTSLYTSEEYSKLYDILMGVLAEKDLEEGDVE